MPTTLDNVLPSTAKQIVAQFGKPATFHERDEEYLPSTGETATLKSEDHSEKVTPPERYSNRYVDGDSIRRGDVHVLLPAYELGFTPVPGMQVTMDNSKWRIIDVGPIYSGELVTLYRIQLRR